MNLETKHIYLRIQEEIQRLPLNEFLLTAQEESHQRAQQVEAILQKNLNAESAAIQNRVRAEMASWGPLGTLFEDEDVSEILVNGPESIWVERDGRLSLHNDIFFSELSFRNCLERICQEAQTHLTVENPYVEGKFLDFRLTALGRELTTSHTHLSLRRHPKNPWTFSKLSAQGWCGPHHLQLLETIFKEKKNFMVVGPTGSGKTSVLNAFLHLCGDAERAVIIEDTSEIIPPNGVSLKLLTRDDPHKVLSPIDQTHLLKRALRLRPDRLVMGEVRGAEAKDFLMALATGHAGSFGTLHAQTAAQALIRLEMLIQMGAPQWGLTAIRRLIQLSLDYVIVVGRNEESSRKLQGIYQLSSLEEHGFLLEAVHEL